MRVETGCRLHFGLIDLNGEIGRVDGSIGLSLNKPGISVKGELSDELEITGDLTRRVSEAAQSVLNEINGVPVRMHVDSTIPQHVGLGSGTQVALAAGTVIAKLNESDISAQRLAEITGRGGTSGIGTAAFDGGGFIVDGGHDFSGKNGFIPSSVSDLEPPPVIARYEFPDWEIVVFLPEGEGAHGRQEFDVFNETCPIESEEVQELSRIILMKLLPSIKTKNFQDFKESIDVIQYLGFKNEELRRQAKSKEIFQILSSKGYAAGLSSLGPAVYAIHPEGIDRSIIDCPSFTTNTDNRGASIID